MTTEPQLSNDESQSKVAQLSNDESQLKVAQPLELADFLEQARSATSDGGPLLAGTFAMYPMPDGGIMMVVDSPQHGGTHRFRIAPAMIRAAVALTGGGGKFAAVKAMIGGQR